MLANMRLIIRNSDNYSDIIEKRTTEGPKKVCLEGFQGSIYYKQSINTFHFKNILKDITLLCVISL